MAKTRYDVAALLGYRPSALSFIVYQIPKAAKYTKEAEKRKNKLSHAFRKDRSIITNAKAHKSRRYVLNLDLQNFLSEPALRPRARFLSQQ
jgi:RNA-directed DNA polymerase